MVNEIERRKQMPEGRKYIPAIKITDAHIKMESGWRGFGPNGDRFGNRGFTLVIDDPDMAHELSELGWNIHIRAPRIEGEEPEYQLPVKVRFDKYPPTIIMVTRKGEKALGDETVGELDNMSIAKINLTVTPSFYDKEKVGRGTGVSAYLAEMKVWVDGNGIMSDDRAPWDDEELPFD